MADPHQSSPYRAPRWTYVVAIAAAVLAVWSLSIAITGGIRFELGPVRISSRNPVRPALLAIALAAVAWRFGLRVWLEILARRLEAMGGALQPAAVGILAAAVLAVGMVYGVRAAGGADPQGYVSQSSLWLQGHLRIDHRFSQQMPWPDAPGTFAPLGYRTRNGDVLVPTYAPGLPLLMAATRLFSACGPYLVSVVCGALLVVFTYLLGRKYFSAAAGLVAAVMTATSPTVLYMSLAPMADLPSATFWLACACRCRSVAGHTCAGGGRADRYRRGDPAESRGACRVPLAALRDSLQSDSTDGAADVAVWRRSASVRGARRLGEQPPLRFAFRVRLRSAGAWVCYRERDPQSGELSALVAAEPGRAGLHLRAGGDQAAHLAQTGSRRADGFRRLGLPRVSLLHSIRRVVVPAFPDPGHAARLSVLCGRDRMGDLALPAGGQVRRPVGIHHRVGGTRRELQPADVHPAVWRRRAEDTSTLVSSSTGRRRQRPSCSRCSTAAASAITPDD